MTLKPNKNSGSVAESVMGYAIAWLTQPSIPPRSLNRAPARLAWVKEGGTVGCVHLCLVAGYTV